MSSLPAPVDQQQLALAPAPRRAFFGLFDAAGWGWASFRAVLWTLLMILMLGYIPDRAYYLVASPTVEIGLIGVSLVSICPGENKDLPCPAPAGALIPWESGAPVALPGAGEDGSLLQVGSHLYYLGGRASGGLNEYANTSGVSAAEIVTEGLSSWAAVAPLPAPRALSATAYLAGTAYVIGGTSDTESATATVFTGAPDAATGTIDAWMLADALELPAPRNGAAVITVSDGLIVFGGANEFYEPQTTVWKSTLQSNGSLGPWEEMAPLPEPRANAAAALVGDSVWIWGGRDASGYTGVSLHGYIAVEESAGSAETPEAQPVDDQGDAAIGSIYAWTATSGDANLPLPREGAALWSANGTLYVAGGVRDGTAVGSVYWTAPTDAIGLTSWTSVPQVDLPLAEHRTNASGAVIGTRALLIGGEDASGASASTTVSAVTSPKAPVFRAGIFGLTVPGLAISGDIGEQLGFLSAAGAWTLNFVLLCAMAVAYAQRERFGVWLRKKFVKK